MPERVSFLKRAVSFHNNFAFTSEPSTHEVTINKEIDEDLVSTKTLAIILVGLPARGKTHLAGCLERYLNWLNFPCKTFNVEQTRRKLTGGGQSAEFFDPNHYEYYSHRMRIADRCLSDMLEWFESGGNVGIFDATNTTVARRLHARSKLEQCGARVLFLESICIDKDILEKNFAGHKLRSPDYAKWEPEEAARDFEQRIGYYENEHEALTEAEDCSYIKIINAGHQIIMNEIRGYLQGKIVSFLLNSHIGSRTIYLSRHGQSIANLHGKLGGDPSLTAKGRRYSFALADFMRNESEKDKPLEVWTSQLKRTRETAAPMGLLSVCWRALNEIDAGICEDMTYEEVEVRFPDVAKERKKDKLRYRYPQGESYQDVINRLEPVMLELERHRDPIIIVAHNAVIRCMMAYFTGKDVQECPYIEVPLHTVFKLTTRAYGVEIEQFDVLKDDGM